MKLGDGMEVKNLNYSYEDSSPVRIEDINFTLERGSFLSILGENGSYKSTLVKLILGLLKLQGGSINHDFKNIGYVPQKKEKFNMNFPITVEELMNIHITTGVNKIVGKKEAKNLTYKYLKEVGMEDSAQKLFGSLSGGQQQRVLIGRALSSKPDLLILDEPLTGIDKASQEILRKLLKELNNKGLTIISIEHDVAFAVHNSSHILTMKEGHGAFYKVEDFLKHISHEDMDNYLYHKGEHMDV